MPENLPNTPGFQNHFYNLVKIHTPGSQNHLYESSRKSMFRIKKAYFFVSYISLPYSFGFSNILCLCFAFAGTRPLISTMKAMVIKKDPVSSILEQREVKMPEIKDNEVIIQVCACGVNRGDVIDLVTSEDGICPGLECSGIIEAVGRNVNCWKVGDRVCAILEGGGYAEKVAVLENYLLPLSDDVDLEDAAGLPYASCCIWLALFKMCYPNTVRDTLENKKILIREGTSGIGALAIQYAKLLGLTVIASTGVDFVLDCGASDLQRNIECCCPGGKVFIVDFQGMVSSRIDLAMLQKNQAEIKVFDLRSRDLGYKASVIAQVRTHLWPAILTKKVIPAVANRFAVTEAQKALNLLKENDNIGKIIVYMNFGKTCRHLKMD
ncbi:uncharacterized protein [Henckelia pumila]|uniref:uncharacterized protein isoform X2 n=1 Tax=Henckelia pumila TaxID=405737 RepID=UPI003C6DEA2E